LVRALTGYFLGSVNYSNLTFSLGLYRIEDLKILHPPARLATPAISLQDFPAELAVSFRVES
jgi:hypothetical protein